MAYKRHFIPLQSGSAGIGQALLLGPILQSGKLRLRRAKRRARGTFLPPPCTSSPPSSRPTAGCGHGVARPAQEGLASRAAAFADGAGVRCLAARRLRGSVRLLCVSLFLGVKRGCWAKESNEPLVASTTTKAPPDSNAAFIRRPIDTDGPEL